MRNHLSERPFSKIVNKLALTDDVYEDVGLLGAGGEQLEGGELAGVKVPHRLPHELALLRRALVARQLRRGDSVRGSKHMLAII